MDYHVDGPVDLESQTSYLDVNLPTSRHVFSAFFLQSAFKSGKLGSGPTESEAHSRSSRLRIITATVPWTLLAAQLVWSCVVLAVAHVFGNRQYKVLSTEFWESRVSVGHTVVYGVGWALFVLLGFFIKEASNRFHEAQASIEQSMSHARSLLRQFRLNFRPGFWHDGDIDRIVGYLVAFPIALKMDLRNERDCTQLTPILHKDDISDVLAADCMYAHCTRTVRAYLAAGEEDSRACFKFSAADHTFAGQGAVTIMIHLVDAMDDAAMQAVRISKFRPSLGYINHLNIFLHIWLIFLPLVLVPTSGWFTVLWSLLISYCVGMLFHIANALNEPYGFDPQDIKLNRLCSQMARDLLIEYGSKPLSLRHVLRPEHETPKWIEEPVTDGNESSENTIIAMMDTDPLIGGSFLDPLRYFCSCLIRRIGSKHVLLYSCVFMLWVLIVVCSSWALSLSEARSEGERWWNVYIPISTNSTFMNSLGVFLLLSFWINDAYSRYWNSLQTWRTILLPRIQEMAFQLSIMCRRGSFHNRDRERILSHLTALPYATKALLRGSNDLSELSEILDDYDLAALEDTTNKPARCMDVILGYVCSADAADPATQIAPSTPFNYFKYYINDTAWDIERAITQCLSTKKFPISPSFTSHLYVYVTFWLALLPLSLVKHHGFFTILFQAPVGYAIINLISIGHNLSDPFGHDDEDIPLDKFCKSIQNGIHQIYHETLLGAKAFIHEEDYDHASFILGNVGSDAEQPLQKNVPNEIERDPDVSNISEKSEEDRLSPMERQINEQPLSLDHLIKKITSYVPSVPLIPIIVSFVWTVFVVFLSWFLSKVWDGKTRGSCRAWCSPIDIEGRELGNFGVALFLLLSFRASDAMSRYEEGAKLLYDVHLNLRAFVVDFLYMVRQGFFHSMDRERVIAHVAQIPLVIRDTLLEVGAKKSVESETLLCSADKDRLLRSKDPFEYLVRSIETYLLVLDMMDRSDILPHQKEKFPGTLTVTMLNQISTVRRAFAQMIAVKEFPVITQYSNHQYFFTALWLALLPLYMTTQSGFFAILWTPPIAYGVLALQELTVLLVDPFGRDKEDLPIYQILTKIAEEIPTTAEAIGWDSCSNTMESTVDSTPTSGARIANGHVRKNMYYAYFENHEATIDNFALDPPPEFSSGSKPKTKPSTLLHIFRSVPWWALLWITGWASVGCLISYSVRDRGAVDVRWWKSSISVGRNIGKFLSFGTFILLGYYVKAAYSRYEQAGKIWGDRLRASCHAVAVQMYTLFEEGTVHPSDHDRVLGHMAAIPLVLKHELRGSKDLSEVKGLLSLRDLAQIQTSTHMTMHCIDVVRAYFAVFMAHKDRLRGKPIGAKHRYSPLNKEMRSLQRLISHAHYLNEVALVPAFVNLLNLLLSIFFIILPFEFAEVSGWITIFWTATVSYGVVGIYAIAGELKNPFGMDVNDLDLDRMANSAVVDLLFLQKHYKAGLEALARKTEMGEEWKDIPVSTRLRERSTLTIVDESRMGRFKTSFWLALQAMSARQAIFTLVWTVICVSGAWMSSRMLKVNSCKSLWFCTYFAVEKSLKGFVGFGLFMLLGFRLYDSHFRYVLGLRLWQDGILGKTRLLLNRVLQSYPAETWHEGDHERICGHLAAFSLCLKASLRNEPVDVDRRLMRVLGPKDVQLVTKATDPVDYCIDVLRGYFNLAERLCVTDPDKHPASLLEHKATQRHTMSLAHNASECRRLVTVPLPFGYVKHLRIFLKLWLLLLPLGLVESTGWMTILWVPVISYAVLGMNHWADELADPFGHDVSDVPLDELCGRIIEEIKSTLIHFREGGIRSLVRNDRPSFSCTWSNGSSLSVQ